jgi:hypothetical protein
MLLTRVAVYKLLEDNLYWNTNNLFQLISSGRNVKHEIK